MSVTAIDSPAGARDATRNARLVQLTAEIVAGDAKLKADAAAGNEYARWLMASPAAPAKDRATAAMVYRAAESGSWCANRGRGGENTNGRTSHGAVHCRGAVARRRWGNTRRQPTPLAGRRLVWLPCHSGRLGRWRVAPADQAYPC